MLSDTPDEQHGTLPKASNNANGIHGVPSPPSINGKEAPVIIVGAGPVGLLLALILARKNIRTIVLEKNDSLDTSPRGVIHYPPVFDAFKAAGIYDDIVERGFCMAGNSWRKPLVDDGDGNKMLGPKIAQFTISKRNADGIFEDGRFVIDFVQGRLVTLMLEKIQKLDLIQVVFNAALTNIAEDSSGVTVTVETAGGSQELKAQYLAGCDGGKSTVRKLLGIKFSGHAWPERLLATDVKRVVSKFEDPPAYFVVDRTHWGVVVPLEAITPGEPGLWRYAMPVPDATLTDEDVVDPKYVNELLLKYIDGPRPSNHVLVRQRVYRIQQLLATTMHRGRVVLAGDAGHLNNPIGGLGLCTGLLDADILAQALDAILNHGYPDPQQLLAEYSAARRFVFQNFVDPISSANKLRLHESDADDAAKEDWYYRALARADPVELARMNAPFFQAWRTDIRQIARDWTVPEHEASSLKMGEMRLGEVVNGQHSESGVRC